MSKPTPKRNELREFSFGKRSYSTNGNRDFYTDEEMMANLPYGLVVSWWGEDEANLFMSKVRQSISYQ